MTKYYMLNENTLGYVNDDQPEGYALDSIFVFGILRGLILKGSRHNSMDGCTVLHTWEGLREATAQDFDEYGVTLPPELRNT